MLKSIPVGTGRVAEIHREPCFQSSINLNDESVCFSKFTCCYSKTNNIYIPLGFLGIHLSLSNCKMANPWVSDSRATSWGVLHCALGLGWCLMMPDVELCIHLITNTHNQMQSSFHQSRMFCTTRYLYSKHRGLRHFVGTLCGKVKWRMEFFGLSSGCPHSSVCCQ